MTLIAALIPDGRPVLLGDLLISAERPKQGGLPVFDPVFLPSVGLTVPPDPSATHHIVATRQKLCVITDSLAIGWSGSYPVAERIVRAMFDYFSPGPLTLGDIEAFLATCDYDDLFRSGLRLVGSCFNNDTNSRFGFNSTKRNLPLFGVSYVAGSGSRSFIDLCDRLGHQEADFLALGNTLSRAILRSLLTSGMLIADEIYSNQSLDVHFFGGFYEMIFRLEPGLRKMGDVTYIFWQLNVYPRQANRFGLRFLLLIKLDYERDILIIRRIHIKYHEHAPPSKDDGVLIVPPIYRDVSEAEIEGKWHLNMNAKHCCHVIFVRMDDKVTFLVIPEVSPITKSVVVEEECDGTQHFKVTGDFIHRVVEEVVQREGL